MKRFREAVEAGDVEAIVASLAEDVVFHSPIVFRPYQGRAAVGFVLRAVASLFRDFRYTHELRDGAATALVFRARVGDREIEGVDLGEVDAEGNLTRLTVFVRPLTATMALAEAMRALLEGGAAAHPEEPPV